LAQAISTLSSQFANQWRAFLQRGYVDLDSPPEFLCALVAAPAPRKQKSEEASPQGSNKKQKSSDSSAFSGQGSTLLQLHIEGMGCTCHADPDPQYAHVDISIDSWKKEHIPGLSKFMEHPEAKKAFELTEKAVAFLS
jgi:hypothetical protein